MLKVGQGKGRIGDARKPPAALRPGRCPTRRRHLRVFLFVGVDAFGRVQVEGGLQVQSCMQKLQECRRVGEELAVPGVAGPAGAGVAGLGEVPVHVDDAHRKRHLRAPRNRPASGQ